MIDRSYLVSALSGLNVNNLAHCTQANNTEEPQEVRGEVSKVVGGRRGKKRKGKNKADTRHVFRPSKHSRRFIWSDAERTEQAVYNVYSVCSYCLYVCCVLCVIFSAVLEL